MSSGIETTQPSLRLQVVGLNHKTAPLAVRETLAFNGDAVSATLAALREKFPHAEAVLLSTCNRVEMYVARPVAGEPTVDTLAAFLAESRGLSAAEVRPHLFHHEDRAAVEHLFMVASSLDSMVLGETQILAQVKQAYQIASQAGTLGVAAKAPEKVDATVETTPAGSNFPSGKCTSPLIGKTPQTPADTRVFHTLFQRAIAAAKDVHEKTHLGAGRLSIASVAVDLARGVFDRFDDKTVVCVGAGKMANLLLTHLRELHPKRLVVTNRSIGRAEKLAAEFGGEAAGFDRLEELLVEADIVLTSTGAPDPVITEPMFKSLLRRRSYRPVVMIDIAVPRDVAEGVGKLSNVYLYNIDDLQDVAESNRGKRDALVAECAAIVAKHVDEFSQWFAARDVGPVVKALYAHANAVARAELDQLFAKSSDMSPEHRAAVERFAHRVIGKLLHSPVTQITQQTEATTRPFLVQALRKLFGL